VTTAMRMVLALLTAMLATFAVVTSEVAAQGACTGNPCTADGDTGATCTPNTTGYTCTCDTGFTSNGVTCAPQASVLASPTARRVTTATRARRRTRVRPAYASAGTP
jgi:hypothetical protein